MPTKTARTMLMMTGACALLAGCIPYVPPPQTVARPAAAPVTAPAPALAPAPTAPPGPTPSPAPAPAPTLSPAPAPAPAPTPTPTPPPTPTPASLDDWMDQPQTPGNWHYYQGAADSYASFVAPDGRERFRFTCTAQGTVLLSEPGHDPAASRMLIRTETASRDVPATATPGAVITVFAAPDRFLDAIAFSRGRFAVRVAGLPDLFLPSWPEITRVISDCR